MRGGMRRPVFVFALLAVFAALSASPASAQEPLWQDLGFVPSGGGCEGPFILEGTDWPDGTVRVELPGRDTSGVAANAVEGSFRLELSPELFADRCFPGAILGVRVERLRPADGQRVLGDAFYEVPSPWTLTVDGCNRERLFTLSGFPPNEEVRLSIGGPPPLYADSDAPITTVTVDEAGRYAGTFEWLPCVDGVQPPVRASLADAEHPQARWAARSNSAVTPAATGHGVVPTTGPGVPFVLGVLAVAIFGGARLASRRRG